MNNVQLVWVVMRSLSTFLDTWVGVMSKGPGKSLAKMSVFVVRKCLEITKATISVHIRYQSISCEVYLYLR